MTLPENYALLYAEWTRLLDQQDSNAADSFYFQNILPVILPTIRERSGEIPKYKGVISLLGFTPETVILTSRLLEPSILAVLYTPETERLHTTIATYCGLESSRIRYFSFLHDEEHTDDIYAALKQALLLFSKSDRVAIELTGGKKTMSVQLSNAVAALRHRHGFLVDVVYIDYDKYLPKYRKPVPETSRLLFIQDPPATAYAVFGHVEEVDFKTRQILVNPIFSARGFPLEQESAFVLMPFSEPWSDRIWTLVQDICRKQGLRAKRADDLYGHDIMEDIWKGISQARVIIADLTDRNANVFYELGIAHTLGKRFILITQNIKDLPFDLSRYRCIEYADNSDGYKKLETGLTKILQNIEQQQNHNLIDA
jgi:hypothetical protein